MKCQFACWLAVGLLTGWGTPLMAEDVQQIVEVDGTLFPGETKTFTFLVDPALRLRADGGGQPVRDVIKLAQTGLTTVLVDPAGRRITVHAPSAGDPSIRLEDTKGYLAKGEDLFRTLVVDHPPAGRWSVELLASGLQKPAHYTIRISLEGAAYHLSLSQDLPLVRSGEPVHLEARLRKHDQPLLQALVTATVRPLFGGPFPGQQAIFRDDGTNGDTGASDGVYTAIVTLDKPGDHVVQVTATDGETFERMAEAFIQVAVDDEVQFTGKVRDEAADQDQDGKYETLDVVAEVSLTQEAVGLGYFLKGHLSTVDGRLIYDEPPPEDRTPGAAYESVQRMMPQTTVATGIPNTIGTHVVRLSFPGSWILKSKTDGPYQVTLCVEHSDSLSFGDVRCEGPQTSRQSQPYRWKEFEAE